MQGFADFSFVAEIAELVGKLTSTSRFSSSPILRRANRIRTIHGSLAIEQNTLSLEQVTAVLNGKQVLAPPKDIAEVKNAYEMSDGKIDKATLRWKKVEAFLQTHDYIMNADVRAMCGVSAATANRILVGLAEEGRLVKFRFSAGAGRGDAYSQNPQKKGKNSGRN